MNLYLSIAAYPEVPAMLAALKAKGKKLAILSNGSPAMLAAAVDNAGIVDYFDSVLSVEEVGVYKPHPDVYGRDDDQSHRGCPTFSAHPVGVIFPASHLQQSYAASLRNHL